jgi:EAL domain-containing protein (putative c-di-GMP-specific phosphodiesterase class I)/GGDEF domain-containing protein
MSLSRRLTGWLAAVLGRNEAPPALAEPTPSKSPPPAPVSAPLPLLRRPRQPFDAQAEELEALRRAAHTDDVTGLPNRRHFVGRLGAALSESGVPAASLLILRVLQLEALNRRLGHDTIDRVLAATADIIGAYPDRVPGAFAGRLNGSDFALCLPVSGVAEETANTLLRALRASPAGMAAGAEMVVGGVEGLTASGAGEALAAADVALAEAEARGAFSVEVRHAGADGEVPVGERAWRQRIELALAEGRASLAEYAVKDRAGGLIHLACPLRVQLDPAGPHQAASRWLAMASRGRLLPLVDLAAIELALAATTRDGQPRCVHVSAAALSSPGFVGDVQRRLEAAPAAAPQLWLDIAEGQSLERLLPRLREAGAAWRRHGVHLGLEHAGASLQSLPKVGAIGFGHLKVGARFVRGLAGDAKVREFANLLVALAHGLGWKIIAEAIEDERELAALWDVGFDGATGPALD